MSPMPETSGSPEPSANPSRATAQIVPIGAAIGLFVLLQLALWALGLEPSGRENVWWWTALSTLAAERGFFNVWTPYPPLFAILHYVLVKLFGADTGLLAQYFFEGVRSAEAVAAYDQTFATMKAVWVVFNAVFLLGQAALIYRLAQWRLSTQGSLFAAGAFVLFNLSWQSKIVIGLACDQFDYFPGFFFLLGLLLLIEGRATGSALAAGVGAMVKIYPGLLVPLAWANLGTARRALIYTAIVGAVCLAVAGPFLYVNPDIFLATYQSTGSRPGWESVWVYPNKAWPHMPTPPYMVGQFDIPIPEVVVSLGDNREFMGNIIGEDGTRLSLELLNGEREEIPKADILHIQWMRAVSVTYRVLVLVTLAVLLASAWLFREALRRREGLLRGALLSVLILLFFSKGISSYFLLWFFPFLFVLYPPLPACGMFSLFLLAGNLEFVGGPPEWPCYWVSIFLRQALLLTLAIDQVRRLRSLASGEGKMVDEPMAEDPGHRSS